MKRMKAIFGMFAVAAFLGVGLSSYAAKTEKDNLADNSPTKILAQADLSVGDTAFTVRETPVYTVDSSGDSVEVTVEQLASQGIKLIGDYPGSGAPPAQWVSWAGNIVQFIVAVVLYFLYRKEKRKNE